MESRNIAPISGLLYSKQTTRFHRSPPPPAPFEYFFIFSSHVYGVNALRSNHGDAVYNGDDVDCHGNTGWVVGSVWDKGDRGVVSGRERVISVQEDLETADAELIDRIQ